MARPDYYETLGIPPSASQEELRGAHRELVKRYHPDIYSTAGDKARATEKLQAINEAYAVLGNAERRKAYDMRRSRARERPARRPAQPRADARNPRPSRPAQAGLRPVRRRKKFQWRIKLYTLPWLAAGLGAIALFAVVAYSFSHLEPRLMTVWVLLQKTEFEPARGATSGGAANWERLSSFASQTECAAALKSRLDVDQAQGSHAVFDEARGNMAIAVWLMEKSPQRDADDKDKTGGAERRGASRASGSRVRDEGLTKRIRYYECRAGAAPQSESGWRRTLRAIGFVS